MGGNWRAVHGFLLQAALCRWIIPGRRPMNKENVMRATMAAAAALAGGLASNFAVAECRQVSSRSMRLLASSSAS